MEIKINLEKDTDFRNEVRELMRENVLSILRAEKYEIVEEVVFGKVDKYVTNEYIDKLANKIANAFIERHKTFNRVEDYINKKLDELVLQEFNKRFK